MKVAKIACTKCGSKSLRDDGGIMRCVQCGRTIEERRAAPVAERSLSTRDSRWDMPRR